LLAGAGLLFRSFMRLQAVNAGFTPQQVLTARLSPAGPAFQADADYTKFYDQVLARVRALPGVQSTGLISTLPLAKGPTTLFRVEGRPVLTIDNWPSTNFRGVTPDYFRAMNIPVLQGRAFTDQDTENSTLYVVVNQALADINFPGENPVGKRITFGNRDRNNEPVWFEIAGVTANVRSIELREPATPELYFTNRQNGFADMSIVVRSTVEPASLAPALRQVVAEVNNAVPVSDVKTMEHIVSESVTQPRFNLFLLGLFSAIALLLSAAGIYGVTAYTVSQRTHELGIRIALGAQRRDVFKLVLGQGLGLVVIGIVVGSAAALALTRLIAGLLFGVSPNDTTTFLLVSLTVIVVALVACYLPARRATRVDPLVALRYE
jgi:putative ABC transport system permease protein